MPTTDATPRTSLYPFTEEDSRRAYDEWGANCGPNALAFMLGLHIDAVRGKIPGFDDKRYTSPTMMRDGLLALGRKFWFFWEPSMDAAYLYEPTLVRVQWTGPWTAPGSNPKWAYRQTHWIVVFHLRPKTDETRCVFDVNGGVRSLKSWEDEIVPILTGSIKRADGGWYPTHVWSLAEEGHTDAK